MVGKKLGYKLPVKIRRLINKNVSTLSELATLSSVNPQTLYKNFSGQTQMSLHTAMLISAILLKEDQKENGAWELLTELNNLYQGDNQ